MSEFALKGGHVKVLSVVGARPQFVKLAPIHAALVAKGHEHIIVHTGQHYDSNMSDVFFTDLGIPKPTQNLHVGSGTHGAQTASMLSGLEESFLQHRPDWVLVYGDTNSTLAAAIAAVKIHIPLAHLEAGLRSFNKAMPEEHNRILTDHASDLLLAPTQVAMEHLEREGLAARSVMVGDVMTDVCFRTRDSVTVDSPEMPQGWVDDTSYIVATIHRQENTDDPQRLSRIVEYLAASSIQVRLLAHPRLKAKAQEFKVVLDSGNVSVFDPLAYPQLVHAVMESQGVVTDSGGLQKEAFLLGVPCITVRTETEWTETIHLGWNTLIPECDQEIDEVLHHPRTTPTVFPYGTGNAAQRAVEELEKWRPHNG
jgi:UDP-N-acetylglucosamine 2-epimerase (non-hydrolysing)